MLLIENATIVNEHKVFKGSISIKDGKINQIITNKVIDKFTYNKIIDAKDKILIPGIIDDQVHFREPGMEYKADIYSESRAAVAGGITSFMEMPNTKPQATTIEQLNKKFNRASEVSLANYSFYLGATNNNLSEILKINPKTVCGLKVFMGSSTGNMLVNRPEALANIFKESPVLIATHCEDEATIKKNTEYYKNKFGENIEIKYHPIIRSEESCYKSSSLAIDLAEKYNSRLHILHISTAKETHLFKNDLNPKNKKITAEVCVHHLWFDDESYKDKGTLIKWNPAIKTESDKNELFKALLDNRIDVIATDHAPHTLEEKQNKYFNAPSGGPMVQHSLLIMLEFYKQNRISLEKVVEKMCHTPADIFNIEKRGYIKEGYWADLVLIDLNKKIKVSKNNILYKCGWSPLENQTFSSSITHTIVNGNIVYDNGEIIDNSIGMQLKFER